MDFDVDKCSRIFNVSDPVEAQKRLYSDMDKLILQVIIPAVSALGIIGNSAFLFMIMRLPKMRTYLSAFLGTLAISDVLFLILSNIWYAITLGWTDVSLAWPVNSLVGCVGIIFTTHIWYFVSVGVTTLISIEQYLAICKPLKYRFFQSKMRNLKMISFTILLAGILTASYVPRYAWYNNVCLIWPNTSAFHGYPSMLGVCGSMDMMFNVYEGLLFVVVFLISATGNVLLYSRILIALGNRTVLKKSGSVQAGIRIQIEANRVRNQVARTLIINGIVFFVCQIPSRVDNLDDLFDYLNVNFDLLNVKQESTVTAIGHAFLFLNSIINPFIYVFSCRHYRIGMLEAFGFKRQLKRLPSVSNSRRRRSTIVNSSI